MEFANVPRGSLEATIDTRVRVPMSDETFGQVEQALQSGELGLDTQKFEELVGSFKQAEPLDPLETVVKFEACSPYLKEVVASDLGLLRPQRGREQLEAELRGFEEDYALLFSDPEQRQILRSVCLLRTAMKPFTHKRSGINTRAMVEEDSNRLLDLLFADLDPETMSTDVQQTTRLFLRYDILGKMLWGSYDSVEHAQLKAECPAEFRGVIDDLVLVSYLCAGGAHTKERWFTNRDAATGSNERKQSCVLPGDDTLDQFFMRSPGGPLKLGLAGRRQARHYLETTPQVGSLLRYYNRYKQIEGVWSATLRAPGGMGVAAVKDSIKEFVATNRDVPLNALMESNRLMLVQNDGLEFRLVRDPSGNRDIPTPPEYEEAARAFSTTYGYQRLNRLQDRGDVDFCVGLVEGFNEAEIPDAVAFMNALTRLRAAAPEIGWRVKPVELYAVWWNDGELHEWPEQVLSVIGLGLQPGASAKTALAALESVAAEQGQRRYYGGVPIEGVTVAYGS